MSFFDRPSVLYPTLIKGYIDGPILCKSLDDSELWLLPKSGKLYIPPFEQDGKTWFVSHIQRRAKSFSLLYDPFIFHRNFKTFKLQKEDENGKGIGGTEIVSYFRSPGWRWQFPDEKSQGTPWIWSWGRVLGSHLD